MDDRWLDSRQLAAWVRLAAVLELLPGILDSQMRRDSGLTHFEYYVLAMLSESPERSLRMSQLAARTNSTLPRLSHVVSRLEARDLAERHHGSDDARATFARLTETGWQTVQQAAPGHVETVRHHVVDALTDEQLDQLGEIAEAMLERIDPEEKLGPVYRRYDS